MAFEFEIATPTGPATVKLESGSTAVFVGANGTGKTRLAVSIEIALGDMAHRIAAHRALTLNPEVAKISEQAARAGLRYGYAHAKASVGHRSGHRWGSKDAVVMLNDFDYLIQALFAEQSNTALKTHDAARSKTLRADPGATKFELLKEIWERLLPTRRLSVSGDQVNVELDGGESYSASELSDGERAIFYMLGQALVAENGIVLIVDEPELHVHPAIMSKLWDEIQSARGDCGFVFITHDLTFASTRLGQKFVIRSFAPPATWSIEAVPEGTGFDEELVTLILGSRRPVLFVEGTSTSLDSAVYRACFPSWTVIPRGSCEEVIHAVTTMRRNASLTRIMCSGLVDSDDYTTAEIQRMTALGVAVLPVSEIENLVLLPDVSRAIAIEEGFTGADLDQRLTALHDEIIKAAAASVEPVVTQYCRRRIDRLLKKIDLSDAATPDQIATEYTNQTGALDVTSLATEARASIQKALDGREVTALLKHFDGKGAFMASAAKHLKGTKRDAFEEWLVRMLRTGKAPAVAAAIQAAIPQLTPQ